MPPVAHKPQRLTYSITKLLLFLSTTTTLYSPPEPTHNVFGVSVEDGMFNLALGFGEGEVVKVVVVWVRRVMKLDESSFIASPTTTSTTPQISDTENIVLPPLGPSLHAPTLRHTMKSTHTHIVKNSKILM